MKVTKTELDGVLLIELEAFEDHRGYYIETYNEKLYAEHGINVRFVQDDVSVSRKNVLRGIHGDSETWKLISCLHGEFYLVVVNCDTSSRGFGKWQSFLLSDRNRFQVLAPPKHGNAHLVLSDNAIFHYKQTTYYNREKQFTYKWNDPKFKISWPMRDPILSKRDE
ncbi:MAG: dTDP-4-dehydrorhamnose 3,5-epimerase [Candidatus Omnitrophica bacterium]|nr:dTDP-4-dehydrorhamnose 3,5-epimerase [Candidatus Omnitrophota bacterium]